MKKGLMIIVAMMIAISSYGELKYVFYMIGDGMGSNQVLAAEMYQAELQGRIGRVPLRMTSFPYFGMANTFSASSGITDSAAAGTALATGHKTNNGCLGVDKDSVPVISIAEEWHKEGWPVGIMTSVAIDHATPAAFYAHVNKRSKYYKIGTQLASTGYEFFGGAGFHHPYKKKDPSAPNLYDLCEANGYTFAHGYADAQTKLGADKLILVQANDGIDKNKPSESIPYAIDRKDGDLTLPQIVETAIAYLAPKGKFFMMIEGGKIDYAGHGDDAATNIQEVLDFDQAIELAYQFYLAHPDETLIVVTADHETGGMALGTGGKYFLNLKALQEQKQSIGQVQKKRDRKAIRQLNATARVGWTSSAHTAANVPVFAIGVGAERFTGWYDNTEIVKKIKAGR